MEPKLQCALIRWSLFACAGATVVFAGLVWFLLQDVRVLGELLALPPEHAYFERLAELRNASLAAIGVTFVGLAGVLVYGGLVRSRRIVGPIAALRRHLDAAADGRAQPIAFRAQDHFADLPARYNRLVDVINSRRL